MPDITRIVCPIDFSDPSRHAMEHAAVLAKWYGAPIVALHVHTAAHFPVPDLEAAGYGTPAYAEPKLERARAAVCEFARAVAGSATVEPVVLVGSPAAEIVASAGREPGTLIVMGTHGTSGFERLMLGSVTEKVLRKAACPVMTVPPRSHQRSTVPFKRILCPIDFSPASAKAMALALSFAKEADASLTLLHVIDWPPSEEEAPATRHFKLAEYRRMREKEAKDGLDALIPPAATAWCTPHTRVEHGKPYQKVLDWALEESIDVIVMGVDGRGALDQMFFGSTTNQVIRQAHCPVVTLRR